MKRQLLLGAVCLTVAAGTALGYWMLRPPLSAPAPDIRVEMTPERIARGRHLFRHVAGCEGCHSERDFSRFGHPVTRVAVGRAFADTLGLPGQVVAPNLTMDVETGLGRWSDGEKIRAIREGVSRDGRALFPLMPYRRYRAMCDEDVQALVAYMNTLEPVRKALPRTSLRFPESALVKSAPRPVEGKQAAPSQTRKREYGRYLAELGSCASCHTKREGGAAFAGGVEFRLPEGVVVSTNITPDEETGIGGWSEERFIQRFLRHREDAAQPAKLPPTTKFNMTVMPWLSLAHLEREELGAIYAYLRSQRAVRNAVEKHPIPVRP